MRLFDLFEQYPSQNIRDDVEATLPPVLEVPELDNSNSYRQYRFQSYMAAARAVENGDVPFSAVTPWEQYLAVVGYTDAEIETAKLAARQAGIQIKMLNTSKSHEPDWVNKVSPVANIPMTESRRKLREEENVPRVTEMPDITQPKEIDPKTDIAQVKRRIVVIYPGRFQPLHQAHQQVNRNLQDRFPDADVYIATSDKTDPDKSPFSFNDKVQMARAAGIPTDKIVQVKSPYAPQEITKRYDPQGTVLLIAVGAEDMAEDPRFKFGKKKDGSPTYLQQFDDIDHAKGMDQHGYVIEAPTINFDLLGHPATSATQIRKAYREANGETRDRIIAQLYDDPSVELRQLFDARLGGKLAESIDQRNLDATMDHMGKFLMLCKDELALDRLPKIVWTSDSTAHGERPTFGKYVNDDQSITISIVNRHPIDIMRTLAHELTHYKQDMTQGLHAHSGDTGSAEENQANAMAGIIMRKFDERHPDAFETKPVNEVSKQLAQRFASKWVEKYPSTTKFVGTSDKQKRKALDLAMDKLMPDSAIRKPKVTATQEDQQAYLQAPLDPEGDTDGPGKTGDQWVEEHRMMPKREHRSR